MKFFLVLGMGLACTEYARADLAGSVVDSLTDCANCIATGGDGDCTDECDVVGNADDAVNECCDWWSCSSCPDEQEPNPQPVRTTTVKKPEPTTTKRPEVTRAQRETQARRSTTTKAPTTTTKKAEPTKPPTTTTKKATKPPTTTTLRKTTTPLPTETTTVSTDPIAVIFQEAGCKGTYSVLTAADFAGGNGNFVWDACNAQYDDGSDVVINSVRVLGDYTVAASTECLDDYEGTGSHLSDDVRDIITSDSGCISPSYELAQLDYNPVVAEVYHDAGCTGESAMLFVQDFTGGNSDTAWDACNGEWDDGTAMEYQSSEGTWLKSIQVYPGFTVTPATQCNDDYNYDSINYQEDVISDMGCSDMTYDFNHIDYAVADGSIAMEGSTTTGGTTDDPNNGRCGPLFDDRSCDCEDYEVFCHEENGWCGVTEAHDTAEGSTAYDCTDPFVVAEAQAAYKALASSS